MADRYAIISNGHVANVVVAHEPPPNSVLLTDEPVGPGDLYDGTTFTPGPEPEALTRARTEHELTDLIGRALDALQTIIDAPPVSFSNVTQAQTQVRQLQQAVQLEARVLRRLARLVAGQLDGLD